MDHNSLNIDQQTLEAYLQTSYVTEKPELSIKVGEINRELNVFLFDNNSFFWAFFNTANDTTPSFKTPWRYYKKLRKYFVVF